MFLKLANVKFSSNRFFNYYCIFVVCFFRSLFDASMIPKKSLSLGFHSYFASCFSRIGVKAGVNAHALEFLEEELSRIRDVHLRYARGLGFAGRAEALQFLHFQVLMRDATAKVANVHPVHVRGCKEAVPNEVGAAVGDETANERDAK